MNGISTTPGSNVLRVAKPSSPKIACRSSLVRKFMNDFSVSGTGVDANIAPVSGHAMWMSKLRVELTPVAKAVKEAKVMEYEHAKSWGTEVEELCSAV